MQVEAAPPGRLELLDGQKRCWERNRFCDLTLVSQEGTHLQAHRIVLAGASEPLGAMLDSHFAEGQGGPVTLDWPASVLTALLEFLYCGTAMVRLEDATAVLRLSHQYAVGCLQEPIAAVFREHLDENLALQFLAECIPLSLRELESQCEHRVAEHFEVAARCDDFLRLSPACLGRVLNSEHLNVPNEETVLQAVITWCKAEPGRSASTGLLLQSVRFPLMALRSLHEAKAQAQTLGTAGVELERETDHGVQAHRTGGLLEDAPVAKRRCLPHWWSGFGSSVSGGVVVAGGTGAGDGPGQLNEPVAVALHGALMYVFDRRNERVTEWPKSGGTGRVVVQNGTLVSGAVTARINGLAMDPHGGLLVCDFPHHRILRFQDSSLSALDVSSGQLRHPVNLTVATSGDMYIVDHGQTRVVRLRDGVAAVVAGGNGLGSAANQFKTIHIFVAESSDLYISDFANHRVQRWTPGAVEGTRVAGGNGRGSGLHQLNTPGGLFVAACGDVYIADSHNHRVVKWSAGAEAGVVVAGGHGRGRDAHQLNYPIDVKPDGAGALLIVEAKNHRVTRWGPSPRLVFS